MSRHPAANVMNFLERAITWPWRRVAREVGRWRRGQIYGIRRPRWWPERLGEWPGPRSPHENKSVVIFAGSDRYEFVPAALGRSSGHVYPGTMRPDAADIAGRLSRLGLPADAARTLAVVSRFEGGYDSIQTYDLGKFAWGFIQFAATGGLPRLLLQVNAMAPAVFEDCFRAAGIDVDDGRLVIRVNGRSLEGRAAHNRLHDDPALWMPFVRASRIDTVKDAQVKTAYENYYAHPLRLTVKIAGHDVALGTLFAANEYARAVVCDRSVNRGVGHTIVLFKKAVRRARPRGTADASAILDRALEMESADGARLKSLAQQLATAEHERAATA